MFVKYTEILGGEGGERKLSAWEIFYKTKVLMVQMQLMQAGLQYCWCASPGYKTKCAGSAVLAVPLYICTSNFCQQLCHSEPADSIFTQTEELSAFKMLRQKEGYTVICCGCINLPERCSLISWTLWFLLIKNTVLLKQRQCLTNTGKFLNLTVVIICNNCVKTYIQLQQHVVALYNEMFSLKIFLRNY